MSTSPSTKLAYIVALVLLAAGGFVLARRLQAPDAPIVPAPAVASSSAAQSPPARPNRTASTERPQRLAVALRLDPTLTQGIFMGDRWVSPPDFFFAQPGTRFVVQVKAQHLDGSGEPHDVAGNWNATDTSMVNVVRDARAATLEILRAGDSDVTVAAAGQTVVLHIHAVQLADSIEVHIRQ